MLRVFTYNQGLCEISKGIAGRQINENNRPRL